MLNIYCYILKNIFIFCFLKVIASYNATEAEHQNLADLLANEYKNKNLARVVYNSTDNDIIYSDMYNKLDETEVNQKAEELIKTMKMPIRNRSI